MSIIEGVQSYYRLFGLKGVFLVANARLFGKPIEIAVSIDRIAHPVHLRLRTTDVSLFEEIIVNSEYYFKPSKPPRIIIDAGANIGLTSVFYANKFPRARIIAIEPEEANFEMLKKNAAYYSNILPIQGALWREEAMLNLSNPGTGSWGYQTRGQQESDTVEGHTPGMTVNKLMEQYGIDYIDLLKIDIEGSEKEVFETSSCWIDKVGAIIVELHDHFKRGCSRSVYTATNTFELEWRQGETTFFTRKKDAPSESQQTFESTDLVNTLSTVTSRNLRSRIVSVV
ncbi:MAG: FkbM family methyltransferase [Halobacteriota archaeon]